MRQRGAHNANKAWYTQRERDSMAEPFSCCYDCHYSAAFGDAEIASSWPSYHTKCTHVGQTYSIPACNKCMCRPRQQKLAQKLNYFKTIFNCLLDLEFNDQVCPIQL